MPESKRAEAERARQARLAEARRQEALRQDAIRQEALRQEARRQQAIAAERYRQQQIYNAQRARQQQIYNAQRAAYARQQQQLVSKRGLTASMRLNKLCNSINNRNNTNLSRANSTGHETVVGGVPINGSEYDYYNSSENPIRWLMNLVNKLTLCVLVFQFCVCSVYAQQFLDPTRSYLGIVFEELKEGKQKSLSCLLRLGFM